MRIMDVKLARYSVPWEGHCVTRQQICLNHVLYASDLCEDGDDNEALGKRMSVASFRIMVIGQSILD